MAYSRAACAAFVLVAVTGLSGCVTLPPNAPRSPQDPFERWNRGVYKFNDVLDRHVAKPVARGYVHYVPSPVRTGVSNFFANLEMPTAMINDLLQGQFRAAGSDLGRFLLDSTAGMGGLLDPATAAGVDHNSADFGETLGVWGVHPGPYLELPLLGPSDLRDAPGRVVDAYTNPLKYLSNTDVTYGLTGLDLVKTRASLLPFDRTLQNAFDPYAFVRDAYLQRRAYMISQVRDANGDDSGSSDGASP
ncbi:MAG: VacJ family lipoprotein [Gammaproteobacteria bacterium]|nr:VacJ family lipoprotein [Gammaproteobacteria bacterium]